MTKRIKNISKYKPSALQGVLDLSAARGQVSLSLEHPFERTARGILVGLIMLLACAYVFFVTSSVFNVIARKEATANVASLEGRIGTLEQHYYELSKAVTPDRAGGLGLAPVAQTQYVYRAGNVGVLAVDRNVI